MRPFPVLPAAAALLLPLLAALPAAAIELGLPARCELGKDCFLQQYPDMDAGPGAADPLCGGKTYDGHKGTDLRILSMKDVEKGYAVIAVADGEVLRLRDGEADHVVATQEDRERIAGRECGNGLVMRLDEGYEVQYCHLRRGSLAVKPGERVRKGDPLGEIGASGLAQFPHVHITVNRNGKTVDPLTGRELSEGCTADFSRKTSLFAQDIVDKLDPTRPDILATGLAGKPIDHDALVVEGPPPPVTSGDPLFIAWSWFANLRKGDTVRIVLKDGDGNVVVENTGEPLDRDKASFSAFAGRKRSLAAGRYEIDISVLDGDTAVRRAVSSVDVR